MTDEEATYRRDHAAEDSSNAEIARDCEAIGVKIDSPWDFTGGKNGDQWSDAVARIFSRHLARPHPPMVLEGLMFAGSWLETKDLFLDPVLDILRKNGKNFLGQAAANALLKMLEPGDEDLMRSLILDQSIGNSRVLLIDGYARLAKKSAIGPLRSVILDGDIQFEALRVLSTLGDQAVRDQLIKLTSHSDSYVRKIGRDGLKLLDRKLAASRGRPQWVGT